MRCLLRSALAAGATLLAAAAFAQTPAAPGGAGASPAPAPVPGTGYPSRPIRLVIPWPVGGPSDLIGRAVGERLSRQLGVPVVVENRGGSNGLLGAETVARAAPDGYTVMFQNVTSHLSNPWIYRKVSYDTLADFAPIAMVASTPLVIAANPAFPAKTMAELLALSRARPGSVSIASFGAGSMGHLGIELLNAMAKTDFSHVAYRGGAPAVTDCIAGHVPLCYVGLPAAVPFIKQGKLRALAVTPARSRLAPDAPAVAETPGLAGYDAQLLYGLLAPARTPPEIVARLNDAAARIGQAPDFRQKLEELGADPMSGTPDEMGALVRAEHAKLGRLIKSANIEPE